MMGPLTESGRQQPAFFDDGENDENQQPGVAARSGSSSSFSALTAAFGQRIAELQQALCLRIEDSAKGLFTQDLQGLEACVSALEKACDQLRHVLAREMAVVPKARALLQAAQMQQAHLAQVAANLPQHLPSLAASQTGGRAAALHEAGQASAAPGAQAAGALRDQSRGRAPAEEGDVGSKDVAAAAAGGGLAAGQARKAGQVVPRWYVTQAELASLSSYMRSRTTLEKVNGAVDELAGHAEANARWMAAVRANALARIPGEERRRVTELYHATSVRPELRGRAWFVEHDLRSGAQLRLDKSGRALLMALRHLGRIVEARVSSEALGGSVAVYLMQAQQ